MLSIVFGKKIPGSVEILIDTTNTGNNIIIKSTMKKTNINKRKNKRNERTKIASLETGCSEFQQCKHSCISSSFLIIRDILS